MNFEDKTVEELNEMIAAAEAAKESARDREHTDLLRLADQVKTKAEALGIKPISLFRETSPPSRSIATRTTRTRLSPVAVLGLLG